MVVVYASCLRSLWLRDHAMTVAVNNIDLSRHAAWTMITTTLHATAGKQMHGLHWVDIALVPVPMHHAFLFFSDRHHRTWRNSHGCSELTHHTSNFSLHFLEEH